MSHLPVSKTIQQSSSNVGGVMPGGEQLRLMLLMRSRAVGIDKRQKGFVNLSYSFRFVVEHFESVYRLRPAPSQAGGCLGPRGVWDPAELGPHNSRVYCDIVVENGSNVRGVCKHVTSLLLFQSTID